MENVRRMYKENVYGECMEIVLCACKNCVYTVLSKLAGGNIMTISGYSQSACNLQPPAYINQIHDP